MLARTESRLAADPAIGSPRIPPGHKQRNFNNAPRSSYRRLFNFAQILLPPRCNNEWRKQRVPFAETRAGQFELSRGKESIGGRFFRCYDEDSRLIESSIQPCFYVIPYRGQISRDVFSICRGNFKCNVISKVL